MMKDLSGKSEICVIVLGHPSRGDDAAGKMVKDVLVRRNSAADILYCGGDSMTLINLWRDYRAAIIIDATVPSGSPGRMQRFDVCENLFTALPEAPSSHVASLPEAYRLAAALDALPEQIILFAIEGAQFDLGAPVTPEVKNAVPQAAAAIENEISHLTKSAAPPTEVLHA